MKFFLIFFDLDSYRLFLSESGFVLRSSNVDRVNFLKPDFDRFNQIRIRMFLGLLDPVPLVRGTNLDPDPSITGKNSKKKP
jgi:hypothetical protein